MNSNYISNVNYLNNVHIKFKNTKTVLNFIKTNDINRIKRYFPSDKAWWPSINFEKTMKRIQFDSFLRMNIFNITSSIEISFKSIVTDVIYREYADNYAYNNSTLFIDIASQKEFKKKIKEIKKNYLSSPNDVFLKKYFASSRVRIPISAIIQKLTFGELIHEFCNFNDTIKQMVADEFGATAITTFISNIKCAKNVRNACCHNDVLSNKKFSSKPSFCKTIKNVINYSTLDVDKLFIQLYNLKLLCMDKPVWNTTIARISNKIKASTYFIRPYLHFGFPTNWEELLKS